MNRPRFSILHTSARPDKWKAIYDAWLNNCDRPEDVEYILVCDERWGFERSNIGIVQCGLGEHDIIAWNTGRRCYVEGVNLAAKYATGDILIVVADDQFPCEHWDTQIESVLVDDDKVSTAVQAWLLAVSTGTPDEFDRGIVVMPIMSRSLYEKWGHVFYPEYESMFADNDLCEHAKQDGVLIEARHLFFPHKHPLCDSSSAWDAAYEAQNRPEAYEIGQALLRERRATHFGSVQNISRAKPGQKKSVAVCLPGDTFSQAWVAAWTGTLAWLSQNYHLLEPNFGYSSDPAVTRAALLNNVFSNAAQGKMPDYVLWIDDDNPVNQEHLKPLFEALEEHEDFGVMAGWCWTGDGKRISAGNFAEDGSVIPLDYDQFMSGPHDIWNVAWCGMPCMLVRTEVFIKTGPLPFCRIPVNVWPGAYGEDISFCKKATEAGYLVGVHRKAEVDHLKLSRVPKPPTTTDAKEKELIHVNC